jgi:excisionase family DNA binding protein
MQDQTLTLYTSAEVAEVLRLNHQVVQRKLQAGEIPAYRIGREWRVERAQLLEWLEQRSNQRRDPADSWFVDGRLTAIPSKRSVRRPVLERLARQYEPARTYPEREVNELLRQFHDDVASLRRELVAEKLLTRTRNGVYKLAPPRPATEGTATARRPRH